MQRSLASLLSFGAALAAFGCASLRAGQAGDAPGTQEVERALGVLRPQLDLSPGVLASELDRQLPPAGGAFTPELRRLLFDREMVSLGTQQLIAFGGDRARIESIFSRLAFDDRGVAFPPGVEARPGQVAAALARLRVPPGERYRAGARHVSPSQLAQTARDRYEDRRFFDDPAWLIEAVSYGRDPTQGWVGASGEASWVHGYILGRLRLISQTNDTSAAKLVDGGLPFAASVGRLVPRLAAHPDFQQPGSTREAVAVYLRFLEWFQHQKMEPWLEQAAQNLEASLEAFRAAPGAATAEPFLRRLRDAGHILEMVHDPASWFDGRLSPVEQRLAAEALARVALRWYSIDYNATRAALEKTLDADQRPLSLLAMNQWLHAYHGLSLWLAASRRSGLAPAAVVAEGVVPLADGLAEADVAGAGDEVEPLLRVARDAVEQRAEHAARREAHVLDRLVAQ